MLSSFLSTLKTLTLKALVTLHIISVAAIPSFGAYNPTGGGTYRLQSSIGTTDTSITLSSFKEPVSNIKYTMSYLNSSIEYGTIEPTNNSNKEFISFTGITQNSDGTAILTGVTRGLGFSYPYTASTTLQLTHAGQSVFILSNPPQLTNQYANKNNPETINAYWNFAVTPSASNTPVAVSDLTRKDYVDGLALNGAATSTETNIGLVQLSTGANTGTGVASSTTGQSFGGAPIVLENKFATTTPGIECYTSIFNCIPAAAKATGFISPLFISTTSPYSWGALNTFTSGFITQASSTASATLHVNTLDVTGSQTGLSGKFYLNLAPGTAATAASSTTFLTSVAGGTIGTSNVLKFEIPVQTCQVGTAPFNLYVDVGFGSASTTATFKNCAEGMGANGGMYTLYIAGNGATNAQKISQSFGTSTTALATFTQDSTATQSLTVISRLDNAGGTAVFTPTMVLGSLIK